MRKSRRCDLPGILIGLIAQTLALGAAVAQQAGRPPNIVFILADDLGWRDTALYGSKFYETPNIDALAKRGMMFTNAYAAAPICSPTRASILTGLHPARIGMTTPSGHVAKEILEKGLRKRGPKNQPALAAESVTRLRLEYFTLAEAFNAAGYKTGHFGNTNRTETKIDVLHCCAGSGEEVRYIDDATPGIRDVQGLVYLRYL